MGSGAVIGWIRGDDLNSRVTLKHFSRWTGEIALRVKNPRGVIFPKHYKISDANGKRIVIKSEGLQTVKKKLYPIQDDDLLLSTGDCFQFEQVDPNRDPKHTYHELKGSGRSLWVLAKDLIEFIDKDQLEGKVLK